MAFFKRKNKSGDEESASATATNGGSGAGDEQTASGDRSGDTQYPRDPRKARSWFERAKTVADSRQYDYAIQCYLSGLKFDPDQMDQHEALHDVAMKRKVSGGKTAGFLDKAPVSGKHPVERMLEAEYKWAKDPQNPTHALAAMEQAAKAELEEVAYWLGEHVVEANRTAKKPVKAMYIKARDFFAQINAYDKAADACRLALVMDPQNMTLARELKALEAERTIQQGRYDEKGDFQKSVKDLKGQVEAIQEEAIAKTEAAKEQLIRKARHDLAENPDDPDMKYKLVRALLDKEEDKAEAEAIRLLDELYSETEQYRFRMHKGDVQIKQFRRSLRQMRAQLDKTPDNKELLDEMRHLAARQLKFELNEYTERVKNYPTDMGLRFELGRRQFAMKDYDAAIGSFQEARSDPKHRAAALRYLGEAFAAKQWWDEAVDSFRDGIELHPSNDDSLALALRYNLMDALEGKARRDKDLPFAQEAGKIASQIAQVNLGYKDIRQRVEKLRELVASLRENE